MNETRPTHPTPPAPGTADILVLEPDDQLTSAIAGALREAAPAARTQFTRSLEEAQRVVADQRPQLFVLDLDASRDLGREFLYDLRTSHPQARAIILTGVHLSTYREQAAGLGAIHFLEKPFPPRDFTDLVEALLHPASKPDAQRFQGTLSDLHIADIIQLKCMSGATSALEFTGPRGEKAQVFFEQGQVRYATAPGKQGVPAFQEIVNWKGGMISEISGDARPGGSPIEQDWQMLLLEAVRKIDESRDAAGQRTASAAPASPRATRKILVIDDSVMLLSFVKEMLTEAGYDVSTAPSAQEGLRASRAAAPDLILLDYVLPDAKGDAVCRDLLAQGETAGVPVIYMSGFGTEAAKESNVVGTLNKPFTSELLLKTVEANLPTVPDEIAAPAPDLEKPEGSEAPAASVAEEPVPVISEAKPEPVIAVEPDAPSPQSMPAVPETPPEPPLSAEPVSPTFEAAPPVPAHPPLWEAPVTPSAPEPLPPTAEPPPVASEPTVPPSPAIPASDSIFFAGQTQFFSLNRALQTIAHEKLTGTLRAQLDGQGVELLVRAGKVLLATTRDAAVYCPEAPITLLNVDAEQIGAAKKRQSETGCPLFITLSQQALILNEPALQLVHHHGQKLFARVWTTPRVRFAFEQATDVPEWARALAPADDDMDHWSLNTLRFIQHHELGATENPEPSSVPAYTRSGFERIQQLQMTVSEAQFASEFNGRSSVQQIARNLRLDLKFAQLTLFRFLALEIVECWPAKILAGQQRHGGGGFKRLLGFGS